MLGKRSAQWGLFEADTLYADFVGKRTFYGYLASERGELFRDEDFANLYNAVVAWNIKRVGQLVEQLRAERYVIDDATLAQTTPLMRKHLNPFGRYHFDLDRMRQTVPSADGR
jgi:hypothetical protein